MALCRCEEEHANPQGRNGNNYVSYKTPIGYPTTASICGIQDCENPGLIWLDEEEENSYQLGERIFAFTNRIKIKVE